MSMSEGFVRWIRWIPRISRASGSGRRRVQAEVGHGPGANGRPGNRKHCCPPFNLESFEESCLLALHGSFRCGPGETSFIGYRTLVSLQNGLFCKPRINRNVPIQSTVPRLSRCHFAKDRYLVDYGVPREVLIRLHIIQILKVGFSDHVNVLHIGPFNTQHERKCSLEGRKPTKGERFIPRQFVANLFNHLPITFLSITTSLS